MWQGSQVMQGPAFFIQPGRQLTVFDTAFYRDGVGCCIQGDHFVEIAGGNKIGLAVRDPIEAMSGAQRSVFGQPFDKGLYLFYGAGIVYLAGAVFDISCPIFEPAGLLPKGVGHDGAAGCRRGR